MNRMKRNHARKSLLTVLFLLLLLPLSAQSAPEAEIEQEPRQLDPGNPKEVAVYAGGCFWGVEYYLEKLDGVYDVISGYTGGDVENPTYYEVLSHTTGHVEAVQVTYNPEIIK